MNPAPPVTRAVPVSGMRLPLPANTDVFKTELTHVFRLVDVSEVCDLGRVHQVANAGQIESAKLVPLSDEHEGVSTFNCRILVVGINNFRQQLHCFRLCDGIVGTHTSPIVNQVTNNSDSRSFAHIVSFRFKRETQYGDCLSLEGTNKISDLG